MGADPTAYRPYRPAVSRESGTGRSIRVSSGPAGKLPKLNSAPRCAVAGTSAADQGTYLGVLDADKTLTFDDGTASPRVDLIVARAYENVLDSSGATKFVFEILKGSPGAGTPANHCSALLDLDIPDRT